MLFRCAFRGGRAITAPLPRKRVEDAGNEPHKDECEVVINGASDFKGVILVHEAVVHDIPVWAQINSSVAVDRLFPMVVVVEAVEGASEEMLGGACRSAQAVGDHALCSSGWGLRTLCGTCPSSIAT